MLKYLTVREFNRLEGVVIAAAASAFTVHEWALGAVVIIVGTILSSWLERKQ